MHSNPRIAPLLPRGEEGLTGLAVGSLFVLHLLGRGAIEKGWHQTALWSVARPALWAGVLVAVSLVASSGPQAFIYFQF